MTLGTVAAFGLAAALVGAGDAGLAFACDKTAKTASAASSSDCSKDVAKASATTASTTMASCCPKDGAKATTAGNVHKSMIKSAVVAPGAAPVLNVAAFAATMSATTTTAGGGSCCDSKSAGAAQAAGSCDKSAAVHTAGAGKSCDAAAKTAGTSASCDKSTQTAAAAVDVVPYREDKRLVLTGTYECGHCGVGATAECSPMFKTADGKVYPLWNSDRVANLRSDKAAKNVEIATVVKKVDGVKYLDLKSYKVL